MTISDRVVTREFRNALARELPGLGTHAPYWKLCQHLMFSNFKDIDTKETMIPWRLLASMEGKPADANYSGMKFLDAFRDQVFDFDITEYVIHPNPRYCKVRRVGRLLIPPAVEALICAERRSKSEDRVFMSNGNKFHRKHVAILRQQRLEEANWHHSNPDVPRPSDCLEVQTLLKYMESLPANRFTKCLTHLPQALDAAERIEDLASRARQQNILQNLYANIQPVYKATDSCTRIFSVGDSMLYLKSELRHILTQDFVSADLRSAQLGIVAAVWKVQEIADYLRTGRNIWQDLCEHLCVPFNATHKSAVKKALYSLTYGAGRKRITAGLSEVFDNASGTYRNLMRHPIMKALKFARFKQQKQIRDMGGAYDAFGNFMSLEDKITADASYIYPDDNSILACIAQSYELKLLYPCLKAAIESADSEHGANIMTWLHDGFTFAAKTSDIETWKQRLEGLVEKQAAVLGIITQLEFS